MNPNRDPLRQATRFVLHCAAVLTIDFVSSPVRADRQDDFKKLEADYAAALQKYHRMRTEARAQPTPR